MPKAGITYGPRIEAPDYEEIKKAAEKQVHKAIGFTRPEDLLKKVRPEEPAAKAAQVLEQADAEIALHLNERDQALAHLWFYDPRLGLARTAGLSTMGYRGAIARIVYGDKKHALPEVVSNEALARIGGTLGVKRVKDAEAQLLKAAPIVYAARARRDVAVRFLQDAVLALSLPPYEWTPERIAEHVGMDRASVYKLREAALKRYGMYVPRSATA
ncbi:hypothetical protein SEA_GILGAMESH_155 [Streptomyces phage Gilgamesh]|uniref:Uncharacterized protein n=1 Tax=Streptomyces phage Gilgamesh TaxID=2599890 RepID=A0A5J6TTT8_9CAUD|nr:hypothetical protein QEH35_gp155 [Streptomyces phage Gilgamesh]QFG13347.1 hypothetical protein SEA_GILGAMESH_155 [Streptomyces phage Gilgamesh]